MTRVSQRVFVVLITLGLGLVGAQLAEAVIPISTTTPATQNFDGMGTDAAATIPTDWRAGKETTARLVGPWSAGVTLTQYRAGNNMSSSASNGIYNYAAGDPATATDRALGFISSSSATKSGNVFAYFNNGTGAALDGVTVSYDVEKYRQGSNAAGFSIQMYYSLDGSTWSSAGASFLTSYAADADNSGYPSAPGVTTAVSSQTLTVTIPSASDFYLAWNYSVTSGTTTSNAQGLGIDNVSVLGYVIVDNPPTVDSTVPVDEATGVAVDTDLTVTFSEPVTVTEPWFSISCATSGLHAAAVTGGPTTWTLDPDTDFSNNEVCIVTILASGVVDQDGTADPMAANFPFNFTTTAETAPSVLSTTPTDGATGVNGSTNITVVFTEPVDVTSPWFDITCTTSGGHTAAVSGGPTTFTLDPDADFSADETCTVTIYAAQVADQDLVPPANMEVDYFFDFTMASATPPSGIGAVAPAFLATGDDGLFTVTVTPGVNPSSTGLAVTCNFLAINGADPQPLYDDGSHGDVAAGDNIFSFLGSPSDTPTPLTPGAFSLPCTISDNEYPDASANLDFTLVYHIHTIQGDGLTSPFAGGANVSTRGVVTALRSSGSGRAFFIQEPEATYDTGEGSELTSEGILVYAIPTGLAVGDLVAVTGPVVEYKPAEPSPLFNTTTEFSGGAGNPVTFTKLTPPEPVPVPAAVVLTSEDTQDQDSPFEGFFQLEMYEDMLVTAGSFTTVVPSSGSYFWATVTGTDRPFREAGIHVCDPVDPAAVPPGPCVPPCDPAQVPRWDGNPEAFDVNSAWQTGTTAYTTRGGDILHFSGPLQFSTSVGYRAWQILAGPITRDFNFSALPASEPTAEEYTVATFNLEFFGVNGNYTLRMGKAVDAISNYLKYPDILAVQEVKDLATLTDLATALNATPAAPAYSPWLIPAPAWPPYEPPNQNVGFLVKEKLLLDDETQRVEVVGEQVYPEGVGIYAYDPDGVTPWSWLNDRPPLRLHAIVNFDNGTSIPLTVITVHQRSLSGVDDMTPRTDGWPTEGDRVRSKRALQAEFLADLVSDRQLVDPSEQIIVLGDFNSFEFNDGYVDVLNTTSGQPSAPPEQVVRWSNNYYVTDPLIRLAVADPLQDYSYIEYNSAQNLDHILVNQVLRSSSTVRLEHPRIDPDFTPADAALTTAEANSDHEPGVAFFRPGAIDTDDLAVELGDLPVYAGVGTQFSYNVNVASNGPNGATNLVLVNSLAAETTFVSVVNPVGWTCDTPAFGSTGDVTCTNPSMAGGTAVFSVTVEVAAGTPLGTVLHTTAEISSAATDPNPTNNTDSADITVAQAPAFTSDTMTKLTVGTFGSFTVTTTGYPTASITRTGALPSGVTFVDNGNGTATLSGTPKALTAGPYDLTFTATNGVGTPDEQDFTLTVGGARTTTSVVSSINPSNPGQAVRLTGRVTFSARGIGYPTGTITFFIDGLQVGSAVPMVGGAAYITKSDLAPGTHTVKAVYSGDRSFAPSTGTLPGGQTVNGAPKK